MVSIDKEAIVDAYNDVRDDSKDVNWVLLKYDNKSIVLDTTGNEYEDFLNNLTDDERKYGYLRVTTGDELSKRSKFVLITWCGNNVSTLKKAKISVDKSFVKEILNSFAIEMLVSEKADLEYNEVLSLVRKAGGANYGTGTVE